MDFSDGSDSSDDEMPPIFEFAIHNAVESGDLEALAALLQHSAGESVAEGAGVEPVSVPGINSRDAEECTPLHVAILHGKLDAIQPLLDAGARVTQNCEGSPPLTMAVCMGSHPSYERFALAASSLLLDAGAVPFERDDWGRTALHWAAFLGLTDVAQLLLLRGQQWAEREAAQDSDAPAIPSLQEFQDKAGNTALHLAARHRREGVLHLFLRADPPLRVRNRAGQLAAHAASLGGCQACLVALEAAHPAAAEARDRRGRTPHALLDLRRGPRGAGSRRAAAQPDGADSAARAAGAPGPPPQTLVLAPPECWQHHTAPWPRARASPEPPPENVGRLAALTHPTLGALRGAEAGPVLWDEAGKRVALGDLLRVHDWSYVRGIQRACEDLPDPGVVGGPTEWGAPAGARAERIVGDGAEGAEGAAGGGAGDARPDGSDAGPASAGAGSAVAGLADPLGPALPPPPSIAEGALGYLDGDTAVSRGTWRAALAAAGAAVAAVDAVMDRDSPVRNAFCAVRPPGHHAGPAGAVPSARDPHATNGFCLFNNLAVAAAYARCVYRGRGVARVALLDFDVHHGNGTEACVVRAAPSLQRVPFSTPYSEGVQTFPVYKPWLDADDKDNIFFASVQGFGPKAEGMNAYVYPGSGATGDNRIADDAAQSAAGIAEDPDAEFLPTGEDSVGAAPPSAPRVIDVGIGGPGTKVALWRRSWRDKIIPALVNFRPDFIFISAGFDAHRKDEINFRYIGVTERDFEWLTDQLVQVANLCCHGRIVSVLEGGYRIQGGKVSAFSRSVAAHVRALADDHRMEWDPKAAEWEREHEKQVRAEAEAKRAAAAMAAASALLNRSQAVETGEGQENGEGGDHAGGEEDGARKRRRRGDGVDYVALNKLLEEESAGTKQA
ncbi:HDA10 [Auxenochlorella protothecoides x Auxenochlorella symbiontica]